MSNEKLDKNRRNFLTKAGAAGGAAGLTALAGCSGGGSDQDETTTEDSGGDDTDGGDETTEDTGGGGGGSGEPLPTYTYVNNAQSYNPPRHDAINLISRQFRELGLDVEVDVLEWGTLFNRVSVEYDYSFATWHTFFVSEPVTELNNLLHSSNTDPGDGNYAGYENPDVDELIESYLAEPSEDTRIDQCHQIQQTLMDDVPIMPVTHMPQLAVYNNQQVTDSWESDLANGYNSYWTMINLEMQDGEDTLKGYWPETLSTMNVLGHNDESKHVYQFNMLYDKLVQLNGDGEIDPEVSLATDWERVDETTMEYTIRTDHSWHDGEDVTTEDVAFTYNYIVDQEVPLYSTQAGFIQDAKAVDDSTVRINMSEPFGPFNLGVANLVPIIPEHKWADRDTPSELSIEEPVGSGPMTFDYWNKGSEFGLKKFEDHFAPVDFEQRFWRVIPEASTVWELLLNGELNYEPFGRIDRSLDENQSADVITVNTNPAATFWKFTPNERQAGLGDAQMRKALVETIPRTPIVDQILFGFPEPGFNIVSEAFGPLHTEDVTTYEESADAARSRLEEAGYTWGDDDTIRAPSGD